MIHENTLKAVIDDVIEKLEITCILVSHDPLDTLSWADEIMVLKAGTIIQHGTPAQIYNQPVDEYVAGLFGKYNLVTPAQAKHILHLHQVPAGSQLQIRPEKFTATTHGHGPIRGIVDKVLFYGSHVELEVLLAGNFRLTVRGANSTCKKGDAVYVSVAAEDIWPF